MVTKKQTRPHIFRVALLGDVDFGHSAQLLQGVMTFAAQRPHWEVLPLHYTQEPALTDLVQKGKLDAIIGGFLSNQWLKELAPPTPIFAVNTSSFSNITEVPSVLPDDHKIGQLAARHFIERGFSSFLFAGMRSHHHSRLRFNGFCETVHSHGDQVVELPSGPPVETSQKWIDLLNQVNSPAAVFCSDDNIARNVVHIAQQAELNIPDTISVLGVGNTPTATMLAGIGISSIALPWVRIGTEAARLIEQWSIGGTPPPITKLPPEDLIVRDSTGRGALPPIVARALRYMDDHLAQSISIASLTEALNVSQRLLELRFSEALGSSPHKELTRRRMMRACLLLQDPAKRIADIAIQCGYTETSHFYHRFKQAFQTTPAAWRTSQR